ncbi:phosphoenolpyruvate synthase [Solemya pervernicosa gill symbiont]|uniref:Phosphoenolpyruvate synthase n=1 Tax=Solemya pervernicosa gill symbiont TaxID=642797 RepID=A0A1T2KZL7_9GAMM|nr:phosphoenolpyruvate synthase [Solemya pervernicosa gill symbiont]OOZ38244.1 phosphoenolpyruvate synthase [Solemya pervernicosa gill symbiont]
MDEQIIWFESLGMDDVERVGGKNASLGEMISGLSAAGVSVPGGFATTASAFRDFLHQGQLAERINGLLSRLDTDDVKALADAGATIRQWVIETPFTEHLEAAVIGAYEKMCEGQGGDFAVAVRSSATAEDLPDASFAGQQETFLNVRGIDAVMTAVKHVFASLYNDRAIAYRVHQGFEHSHVALSAGIQKMVRSDIGSAGVMFTLDTESGFRDVVFITSAYGLGETVVQGAVNPDEFYVHKPTLAAARPAIVRRNIGTKALKMTYSDETGHGRSVQTIDTEKAERRQFSISDEQVEELARQAMIIEKHYARPMDIEWALDGGDGKLYIVQARPETVESQNSGQQIERFSLQQDGEVLIEGRAIGNRIGAGVVRVLNDINEMDRVEPGDVLVTDMTDPDWEPIMKRASAIVTNRGGRTCHAAIIARELGIPAVVGCGDATSRVKDGDEVTVSCAEGDTGLVYANKLDFELKQTDTGEVPELATKIMMNVGNPGRAFDFASIPNGGVGLARLEFIINTMIGVHPKALLEFDQLPAELQEKIADRGVAIFADFFVVRSRSQLRICRRRRLSLTNRLRFAIHGGQRLTAGYASPVDFYVEKLVEGISTLAATFAPEPVIVRMSDFKSNEYANLLAGDRYEPDEENPMIGYRGAARYLADDFRACFDLECRAFKKVRDEMGLTNVEMMIPFVRTLGQAEQVIAQLEENGLKRGENGLRVIMMCELPSNAILAKQFLEHFDGFSIGSNDMTQLTLGLDRDSGLIAQYFDERDPAVKEMISMAIKACHEEGKYVGICGQGPSDFPDLANWLLEQGISSISLNPDTVVDTWLHLAGQRPS